MLITFCVQHSTSHKSYKKVTAWFSPSWNGRCGNLSSINSTINNNFNIQCARTQWPNSANEDHFRFVNLMKIKVNDANQWKFAFVTSIQAQRKSKKQLSDSHLAKWIPDRVQP